jgi:predicted ABC-class ATPase
METREAVRMDDLHRMLGRLAAQMETVIEQQNDLREQTVDLRIQVQRVHSDQEAIRKKLEHEVIPDVEDYAKLKQRGIGILTVVGALGAVLGTVGEKILSALFK